MNTAEDFKASLIVVAAGRGERLRQSLQKKGQNVVLRKAFHPLAGKPILQWTLKALKRVTCVDEIIVVLHPDDMANRGLVTSIKSWGASRCVAGGERRQDSVLNGLLACTDGENRAVGVHDAARPLIDPEDVRRTLNEAAEFGAAILGSRVQSTVKEVDSTGSILDTLPRENLWLASTPQCASLDLLIEALKNAGTVTDEAMALEQCGMAIKMVESFHPNPKVTTADDCAYVEFIMGKKPAPVLEETHPKARSMWRVGEGSDIHKLVEGRPLFLGGLEIPHEFGALGHSDGDVVLHSLVDALLGAVGLGDIGELFPDTDPANKGAASRIFLEEAMRLVRSQGYELVNTDITIHAEKPKLAPWKSALRDSVLSLLQPFQSSPAIVNIKAKTNEGLDAIGRREAIAARATVLLVRSE